MHAAWAPATPDLGDIPLVARELVEALTPNSVHELPDAQWWVLGRLDLWALDGEAELDLHVRGVDP